MEKKQVRMNRKEKRPLAKTGIKEKKPKVLIRKNSSGKGKKLSGRRTAAGEKSTKLRVLILEDNAADAELMERQLKKDGIDFDSRLVDSQSAYLKAVKAFKPDLILADYNLPKFDALQALVLRKANAPQVPFIIVTGSVSEEIAVECMRQGADDYLLKDRLARLGEAVRQALEKHRSQSEKVIAQEQIEQSARKWTITFDAIKDGMALLAADRTVMQVNRAFATLLDKPFKEIVGKKCCELIHDDRRPHPQCPFKKMLKSGKRESMELTINDRVFDVIVDPITDPAGNISGAVHILNDITDRKRAEEQIRASLQEKEVLLKEIHHRVKNNLQVISGLLTLQAAQINDERLLRVIKDSQSRIWTMALIHQTLYQSGNLADIDMADYIRSLCGNLLSSQARMAMPPNISFDLSPLHLVIDKAIPLALIVNELVTNALKHAFPDGRAGEIRIALRECRDRSRPHSGTSPVTTDNMDAKPIEGTAFPSVLYELTVADNGIGLPAGFDAKNQKSLGLQLVTMLTKQLDGSLAIESRDGTTMLVSFKINEKSKKQA